MRVVCSVALALAMSLAAMGGAEAQESGAEAPESGAEAQESGAEAQESGVVETGPVTLASAESCVSGLRRAQALVRDGHHVDAHLVSQTMSLLCSDSAPAWNLVDAVALAHLEEHARAYALLESIALDPGPLAKRARVLVAWVMVKGDLGRPAEEDGIDGARVAIFRRIHAGRSPGPRLAELPAALRLDVTTEHQRLLATDTKSPWLAGILSSVVPGAGQAYAGSWQGAAVSLLLNGIFITATVELAQNDLYFASATTGMAASIFYVGNILNAVDLVKRFNEGATSKRRMRLENLLIPESQF